MMVGNYMGDCVGFSYFLKKIQPRSWTTQPPSCYFAGFTFFNISFSMFFSLLQLLICLIVIMQIGFLFCEWVSSVFAFWFLVCNSLSSVFRCWYYWFCILLLILPYVCLSWVFRCFGCIDAMCAVFGLDFPACFFIILQRRCNLSFLFLNLVVSCCFHLFACRVVGFKFCAVLRFIW